MRNDRNNATLIVISQNLTDELTSRMKIMRSMILSANYEKMGVTASNYIGEGYPPPGKKIPNTARRIINAIETTILQLESGDMDMIHCISLLNEMLKDIDDLVKTSKSSPSTKKTYEACYNALSQYLTGPFIKLIYNEIDYQIQFFPEETFATYRNALKQIKSNIQISINNSNRLNRPLTLQDNVLSHFENVKSVLTNKSDTLHKLLKSQTVASSFFLNTPSAFYSGGKIKYKKIIVINPYTEMPNLERDCLYLQITRDANNVKVMIVHAFGELPRQLEPQKQQAIELVLHPIEDKQKMEKSKKALWEIVSTTKKDHIIISRNEYQQAFDTILSTCGYADKLSPLMTDLTIVVTAIIESLADPTKINVVCKKSISTDEILVEINGKTYNFTQILKHEPNFRMVIFDENTLNLFFNYVKNGFGFPAAFPMLDATIDIRSLTAEQFMTQLSLALKNASKDNNFEACHAADVWAINQQSGAGYRMTNLLLRSKTMPTNALNHQNASASVEKSDLIKLSNGFRFTATQSLDEKQMDTLLKHTIATICVASQGLKKAKHVEYDPGSQRPIDPKGVRKDGRGIRGVVDRQDVYLKIQKKEFQLASKAHATVYEGGFVSTSINTQTPQQFMTSSTDVPKALYKVIPFSEQPLGTNITNISQHTAEDEIMYPPGCTFMPSEEKQIQNKESYDGLQITKKTTLTITSGDSIKSQTYSSVLQVARNKLIKMQDDVAQELNNTPLTTDQYERLKSMREQLHILVDQLQTNLKTIGFCVLKRNESPLNICEINHLDGLFALIQQPGKEIILLYTERNVQKKFLLSAEQATMIDLNLHTDNKKNVINLNLVKLLYLQSVVPNCNIDYIFKDKEKLTYYDEAIELVNNDYNKYNELYPNRLGFTTANNMTTITRTVTPPVTINTTTTTSLSQPVDDSLNIRIEAESKLTSSFGNTNTGLFFAPPITPSTSTTKIVNPAGELGLDSRESQQITPQSKEDDKNKVQNKKQ